MLSMMGTLLTVIGSALGIFVIGGICFILFMTFLSIGEKK